MGRKLNVEIYENNFDTGLCIYHTTGGILINGRVKIGNNCMLHGNNCIGNKGIRDEVPTIGNNLDLGYGASIIGDVLLGDNIIVAAGSVVTRSFAEGNVIIGGVPADIIKRLENRECTEIIK